MRVTLSGLNVTKMLVVLTLMGSLVPAGYAETSYRRVYDASVQRYVYVPEETTLKGKAQQAWKNPVVKQAAVGAAAGAAASLLTDRSSLLKGAGIGALVGAGTGYIDKSNTLGNHPMAKSALKGAAIGTGLGAISGRGSVKGAVVGAGAGAGIHYIKDLLQNNNSQGGSWW
jgi:hypothetical protein